MIKIKKNDINLYDTITCGQIFRYEVLDDSLIVILSDRVVRLTEDNNYIYVYSNNEENLKNIIIDYLDLNRDYNKINNELIKKDNTLTNMINTCIGFKVIHSPHLETMISYITSAFNNVDNIRNSMNLMSEKCGKEIMFEGKKYNLFPTLDKLKKLTLEDFNSFKLGFRSERVYEFIQKITEKDIENIDNMTTIDALNYLKQYNGIGLKVASCILLFGYQRFDVFPIDTWIKKYMSSKYNINGVKKIKEYAEEHYDKYSGLVLQYMFHSERNKE